MLSALEALWQGRAFDLPEGDKDKALEFLAREIAASLSVNGKKLADEMISRERGHNCSIGLGVAFPHVRSSEPGDIACAVGWSEQGLEYEACNGKPVHLILMYRVPDAKKDEYLQE